MLYFRIDKANSLMDRFKFMGLEAAECFRAIGSSSATVPSCPCDCSAGRQEHFVPFWPCETMINQKKNYIKYLLGQCFSFWVPVRFGCWRSCVMSGHSKGLWEQSLCRLKDRTEELEHEKDQQKLPESPVSSSSSVQGSNRISIQTFPGRVVTWTLRLGWTLKNNVLFILIPTERSNRHWPICAIAGENRPDWVKVCLGSHFALQASILGLKCGKVPQFSARTR